MSDLMIAIATKLGVNIKATPTQWEAGMQQSRAWMTQEQRDYYDALAELDREFPGIDEGR